MYGKELITYIC